MAKVSFQEGSEGQKAASVMAEEVEAKPRSAGVDNKYALAHYIVKRLSPAKRRAVAARRA